jgi:hypothetical protein
VHPATSVECAANVRCDEIRRQRVAMRPAVVAVVVALATGVDGNAYIRELLPVLTSEGAEVSDTHHTRPPNSFGHV